jgi:hypothetical protein
MNSNNQTARIAGLIYLLLSITGAFSIPVTLVALGNLNDVIALLNGNGNILNTELLEAQVMMSL